MNWILRVDNLSKVYRLGAGASEHGTIYEQISKKIKKALIGEKIHQVLMKKIQNSPLPKRLFRMHKQKGYLPDIFGL